MKSDKLKQLLKQTELHVPLDDDLPSIQLAPLRAEGACALVQNLKDGTAPTTLFVAIFSFLKQNLQFIENSYQIGVSPLKVESFLLSISRQNNGIFDLHQLTKSGQDFVTNPTIALAYEFATVLVSAFDALISSTNTVNKLVAFPRGELSALIVQNISQESYKSMTILDEKSVFFLPTYRMYALIHKAVGEFDRICDQIESEIARVDTRTLEQVLLMVDEGKRESFCQEMYEQIAVVEQSWYRMDRKTCDLSIIPTLDEGLGKILDVNESDEQEVKDFKGLFGFLQKNCKKMHNGLYMKLDVEEIKKLQLEKEDVAKFVNEGGIGNGIQLVKTIQGAFNVYATSKKQFDNGMHFVILPKGELSPETIKLIMNIEYEQLEISSQSTMIFKPTMQLLILLHKSKHDYETYIHFIAVHLDELVTIKWQDIRIRVSQMQNIDDNLIKYFVLDQIGNIVLSSHSCDTELIPVQTDTHYQVFDINDYDEFETKIFKTIFCFLHENCEDKKKIKSIKMENNIIIKLQQDLQKFTQETDLEINSKLNDLFKLIEIEVNNHKLDQQVQIIEIIQQIFAYFINLQKQIQYPFIILPQGELYEEVVPQILNLKYDVLSLVNQNTIFIQPTYFLLLLFNKCQLDFQEYGPMISKHVDEIDFTNYEEIEATSLNFEHSKQEYKFYQYFVLQLQDNEHIDFSNAKVKLPNFYYPSKYNKLNNLFSIFDLDSEQNKMFKVLSSIFQQYYDEKVFKLTYQSVTSINKLLQQHQLKDEVIQQAIDIYLQEQSLITVLNVIQSICEVYKSLLQEENDKIFYLPQSQINKIIISTNCNQQFDEKIVSNDTAIYIGTNNLSLLFLKCLGNFDLYCDKLSDSLLNMQSLSFEQLQSHFDSLRLKQQYQLIPDQLAKILYFKQPNLIRVFQSEEITKILPINKLSTLFEGNDLITYICKNVISENDCLYLQFYQDEIEKILSQKVQNSLQISVITAVDSLINKFIEMLSKQQPLNDESFFIFNTVSSEEIALNLAFETTHLQAGSKFFRPSLKLILLCINNQVQEVRQQLQSEVSLSADELKLFIQNMSSYERINPNVFAFAAAKVEENWSKVINTLPKIEDYVPNQGEKVWEMFRVQTDFNAIYLYLQQNIVKEDEKQLLKISVENVNALMKVKALKKRVEDYCKAQSDETCLNLLNEILKQYKELLHSKVSTGFIVFQDEIDEKSVQMNLNLQYEQNFEKSKIYKLTNELQVLLSRMDVKSIQPLLQEVKYQDIASEIEVQAQQENFQITTFNSKFIFKSVSDGSCSIYLNKQIIPVIPKYSKSNLLLSVSSNDSQDEHLTKLFLQFISQNQNEGVFEVTKDQVASLAQQIPIKITIIEEYIKLQNQQTAFNVVSYLSHYILNYLDLISSSIIAFPNNLLTPKSVQQNNQLSYQELQIQEATTSIMKPSIRLMLYMAQCEEKYQEYSELLIQEISKLTVMSYQDLLDECQFLVEAGLHTKLTTFVLKTQEADTALFEMISDSLKYLINLPNKSSFSILRQISLKHSQFATEVLTKGDKIYILSKNQEFDQIMKDLIDNQVDNIDKLNSILDEISTLQLYFDQNDTIFEFIKQCASKPLYKVTFRMVLYVNKFMNQQNLELFKLIQDEIQYCTLTEYNQFINNVEIQGQLVQNVCQGTLISFTQEDIQNIMQKEKKAGIQIVKCAREFNVHNCARAALELVAGAVRGRE